MASCLIGLGANLGNRRETLEEAVARLGRQPSFRVVGKSPWYETAAVGGPPGQPPFLNGAASLQTSLGPQEVLAVLQAVEAALGRRRNEPWGPRTIDLDLLLYEEVVLNTPSLVLPHPRMAWRRFVLQPAAAVAASMLHPTTGWSISRLLAHLETAAPYVAISGSIGAGKSELARRLARHGETRLIAEPLEEDRLARFYADPTGQAWQTELQFLERRADLLAASAPEWSGEWRHLTVSDFWFDQSLAFARVWLSPSQWAAFRDRWEHTRRFVVRPKLTVLLEAGGEQLLDRVRRRGRESEQRLTVEQLDRIGREILAQAMLPDQGPVLRQSGGDPDASLAQVLAAVQAMECKVTAI